MKHIVSSCILLFCYSSITAQNVGIGTSTPAYPLDVFGNTRISGQQIVTHTSNEGTFFNLQNTSGSINGWNVIATGVDHPSGPGCLVFNRQEGGLPVVVMSDNRNVGIGTYWTLTEKLEVNGNIRLSGGRVYHNERYLQLTAYTDGGGNANGIGIVPHANNWGGIGSASHYWDDGHITEIWYNDLFDVSDERAKRNIRPLETVMDKIQRLQPIRFDINPSTHPGYKNARDHEIEIARGTMGFTAQNIKDVFPTMVVTDEDTGFYTVRNYHQLLSVLVQGMKEQQAMINEQNEKIRRLEHRLQLLDK